MPPFSQIERPPRLHQCPETPCLSGRSPARTWSAAISTRPRLPGPKPPALPLAKGRCCWPHRGMESLRAPCSALAMKPVSSFHRRQACPRSARATGTSRHRRSPALSWRWPSAWVPTVMRATRNRRPDGPRLVIPADADADAITRTVAAVGLARDLVNTPANDMGPDGSRPPFEVLPKLRREVSVVSGDELLTKEFPDDSRRRPGSRPGAAPARHALGQARCAALTLVGKGVCFDTGGLDIKPASACAT
jgi:hypothetical protein